MNPDKITSNVHNRIDISAQITTKFVRRLSIKELSRCPSGVHPHRSHKIEILE